MISGSQESAGFVDRVTLPMLQRWTGVGNDRGRGHGVGRFLFGRTYDQSVRQRPTTAKEPKEKRVHR